MWILVDRERMFVTHKHPSLGCINDLDYIESLHAATVIMDSTHKVSFDQFSDYELKLLHENICGEKFPGFNKDALIEKVAQLCGQLNVSDVVVSEASSQAAILPFKRDTQYRYLKGSNTAKEVDDLFASAMVTVAGYVPTAKPNFVPRKRIEVINTLGPVTPNRFMPTPQILQDSTCRAMRQPSSAPTEAPKTGSKTRIVWDIADEIRSANPNLDTKALRKMVAERCENAGVNSSTMSVQYSKWRAHNNL